MRSKGTQTMQKIVIKKPWGVEIKDYKAGDPIPAGAKFKIFDAKDTAKIEAYADSLDESATYQKKRFKEPAYMYEEYYIKWGKKYFCNMNGDPAWGPIKDFAIPFKSREEADKYMDKMADRFPMFYYNYDVKVVKESKKVVESFLIMDTINSKPTYFHYGKYTGYDWWDDKSKATKFMTKDSAERMIEKMRQEGTDISKLKVISEGRIARGYENLDANEKAKHLLSHPCSKYMGDLKTGNITERAIRKAVKEMLGKPDKDDPQFIIDVNEEGEAPAVATSTANVANPELPLKLKEGCGKKKAVEDDETLENHFKYQTSVAGGMSSDPETCENAKEYEEKTTLVESIIKKSVRKKLTESVGQKLNITLIRKPQNMKEVERDMRAGHGDRVKAVVDKSYKLSANEYDKFVYNFMVHTTYLSGEGGVDSDGTVHVVEITAPGKKTIYVDPEGYDYARYVGW